MSVTIIDIDEWIKRCNTLPVLDVRSPSEYTHAHIPNAFSLPLFSDEQRSIVGTLYKQRSREQAIKAGLDFFNMRKMVEDAEDLISDYYGGKKEKHNTVLVHCWRGGMRSSAVAWLLSLYGFEVFCLKGGYKSFRNWVLKVFEQKHNINILGGYTGSAKTYLLKALEQKGAQVIDLEELAHHKGSAFGGIGQPPQPSQEMFENKLAMALNMISKNTSVWIEDESQRIGSLHIPHVLWNQLRQKDVYFLDIPFNERLNHICKEYGMLDKSQLMEAVSRIKKRLGPNETKMVLEHLENGNIHDAFEILLRYYDKLYGKALNNRENYVGIINKITCTSVYIPENLQNLEKCVNALPSSF
ncbi:MAG: tRNA 2-selenouridine(34) synthase MnmH [Ferruginibacter sp.]|nr:tRNA 2-selenouridine(34) synthase MnmH [Ferruginibacter sp.]